MCELIAKLLCDEMNICRCIKKSIAVQFLKAFKLLRTLTFYKKIRKLTLLKFESVTAALNKPLENIIQRNSSLMSAETY